MKVDTICQLNSAVILFTHRRKGQANTAEKSNYDLLPALFVTIVDDEIINYIIGGNTLSFWLSQ